MGNNRIKCKTLAGPSLVAFALLPWQIIILAVSLLIAGPKLLIFVYVGIIYVINSSIVSLIYRNAFSIVEIDEVGIKNKSIALKWEEINCVETASIELFKASLIPTIQIDMLCLSKNDIKPLFFETNKDCIFIEATKKNIEIIESKIGKIYGRK